MTTAAEHRVEIAALQQYILECEAAIKCCCDYENFTRAGAWLNEKLKTKTSIKHYEYLINKIGKEA